MQYNFNLHFDKLSTEKGETSDKLPLFYSFDNILLASLVFIFMSSLLSSRIILIHRNKRLFTLYFLSGFSIFLPDLSFQVGKLCELTQEGQLDSTGRTVSLLTYNNFSHSRLLSILIVIFISVYEHNKVGILLYGA